jgi:hypothetical protein
MVLASPGPLLTPPPFYEPFKKLPPQPATFYYPVEETQTAPNKKFAKKLQEKLNF